MSVKKVGSPVGSVSRRKLYAWWSWLYMTLGAASLAGGIVLACAERLLRRGAHPDPGLLSIAIILIVFGLLRMANSLYVLRKIARSSHGPTSAPGTPPNPLTGDSKGNDA